MDQNLIIILTIFFGAFLLFTAALAVFECIVKIWERKTGHTIEGHLRDWEQL